MVIMMCSCILCNVCNGNYVVLGGTEKLHFLLAIGIITTNIYIYVKFVCVDIRLKTFSLLIFKWRTKSRRTINSDEWLME